MSYTYTHAFFLSLAFCLYSMYIYIIYILHSHFNFHFISFHFIFFLSFFISPLLPYLIDRMIYHLFTYDISFIYNNPIYTIQDVHNVDLKMFDLHQHAIHIKNSTYRLLEKQFDLLNWLQ